MERHRDRGGDHPQGWEGPARPLTRDRLYHVTRWRPGNREVSITPVLEAGKVGWNGTVTTDWADRLPYLLLWSASGMAMFPGGRWGWPIFTALSIVAALVAGIVDWAGLVVIALFAGACFAAVRPALSTALRTLPWGVLGICAVALATHQVPWIQTFSSSMPWLYRPRQRTTRCTGTTTRSWRAC